MNSVLTHSDKFSFCHQQQKRMFLSIPCSTFLIPSSYCKFLQQSISSKSSLHFSHSPFFLTKFRCQPQNQQQYQFETLFSNLNQATLKREPGSLSGAIFLVAGTTVGAGILAIPAVTQESGFLASAAACIVCWIYMVATGLLIAEVNVKTMCELGSGGVSLVSMARRTLGTAGVQIAWSDDKLFHGFLFF